MKQLDLIEMGNRIRKLREENGLSQEALGEKLHVTGKNVSKWELGKGLITTDMLVALADLFDCDIKQIISGGEYMEKEEMKKHAELYEKGMNLEDNVLFNKNGLNQILFKDCIYDYGDDAHAMSGDLTFFLDSDRISALDYPSIFARNTKSITYRDPYKSGSAESDGFVSFKELMIAEIDRDKSKDDNVIRTFAQDIFCSLWDTIFYNICEFSDERLEKICYEDVQDVGFDWPECAVWTNIDTVLELYERLFNRHKDDLVRCVKRRREWKKQGYCVM